MWNGLTAGSSLRVLNYYLGKSEKGGRREEGMNRKQKELRFPADAEKTLEFYLLETRDIKRLSVKQ